MIERRWWPPVLWAAFILVMTSIPGAQLPRVNVAGLDKVVHFAFYGVLGWTALRAFAPKGGATRGAVLVVAAIAIFAALDEWHQQFIPGRSMETADWMADVSGAALGLVVAVSARRRAVPS